MVPFCDSALLKRAELRKVCKQSRNFASFLTFRKSNVYTLFYEFLEDKNMSNFHSWSQIQGKISSFTNE